MQKLVHLAMYTLRMEKNEGKGSYNRMYGEWVGTF